jgi:hypothetical protein
MTIGSPGTILNHFPSGGNVPGIGSLRLTSAAPTEMPVSPPKGRGIGHRELQPSAPQYVMEITAFLSDIPDPPAERKKFSKHPSALSCVRLYNWVAVWECLS